MNKQPEVTNATRSAFIDAFIILYKQKPLEKITVRELTALAGYNRTTFYHYFDDIYGLYDYLVEVTLAELKIKIAYNLMNSNNQEKFIQCFKQIYTKWEQYLCVLFASPYSLKFEDSIKKEVVQGMIKELQLPADNVKINYVLEYYATASLALIRKWMQHKADMTLDELAAMIRNLTAENILIQIGRYR